MRLQILTLASSGDKPFIVLQILYLPCTQVSNILPSLICLLNFSSFFKIPFENNYFCDVLSKDFREINYFFHFVLSVQFSSVAQSCPTLCDPMNRSTPGLPVHHHLPDFTQTHVHRVGNAIQPSHPLLPLFLLPPILPASESFPVSQLFA